MLVIEIERFERSVAKLRESNAELLDFEQGKGDAQEMELTAQERSELQQTRTENEGVM